jgi:hypothetical protein
LERGVGPGLIRPRDGIEGDEHLAHGGDEGDLGWLAPGDQATMEGDEARAAAAGAERGHVEDAADRAAALGDDPLAALEPAVLGDGRDADQAGDLAPVEAAELGQLGEQRRGQDQADPPACWSAE